ncbi:bifunctional DNA primase/polymerase [Streptomyces sp. AV19]|uniref:bifunctional DNA primase/polymerase n=1 Tax=Streptomyces sp. AV19 TaxID=2793068 RepID=UPI0018FEF886|nr:bifunctional DNA primase/polymerase [Streptomyces sp. AV19]MBH1934260.1 bifunctional DNA primase/polymerase [Streptomyces sp. AV19]MDG4533432.1 bifunctional DNA primase/polymerase [Streptomyces sp. AV19]
MPPAPPNHRSGPASAALEHALAAAAQGLAVIPLSRTKLPAVRSPHRAEQRRNRCRGECGQLGHGVHDATTEPDAIRALFAAASWATGYGIACGRPPHNLVGLDLDVKNETDGIAALEQLAAAHGFATPATVTVTTPSGGQHLWLRGPADARVPNSVGRIAPGIDVRGSGGYLVGPGSLTTRGQYFLASGDPYGEIAAVPELLLQLLAPPPSSLGKRPSCLPVAGRQAVGLVDFVLSSTPGGKDGTGRNDRLYWAACRAYESGGPDTEGIVAALIAAAVHVGLPETEARATVASAARSAT